MNPTSKPAKLASFLGLIQKQLVRKGCTPRQARMLTSLAPKLEFEDDPTHAVLGFITNLSKYCLDAPGMRPKAGETGMVISADDKLSHISMKLYWPGLILAILIEVVPIELIPERLLSKQEGA